MCTEPGDKGDMKLLIVDDHPLIREGLANVLRELDSQLEVLEAESAEEALAALARPATVALVLLDLTLPGAQGMSLLEQMRAEHAAIPVVVLSANDDRAVVLGAIDAGAMGFISKRSPTQVLVNALRLVLAGGVYVPPQALDGGIAKAPEAAPRPSAGKSPRTPLDLGLTGRQADVLALLVQGKPNKAICRELDLAEGTVKTHITAILRALGVTNRTQALFALSRLGIQLVPLIPPMTEQSTDRAA